jgi:hypothetical protein
MAAPAPQTNALRQPPLYGSKSIHGKIPAALAWV